MRFTHPSELLVLRTLLEAEEIECFVMDELTTQINPLYSNAIGGVRLQVQQKDVAKAITVLKESGYLKDGDLKNSDTLQKLDKRTASIPFIKHLRVELRLMIIVAVPILFITLIVHFATLPSTYERLTKNNWCVDKITFNGEQFTPNTSGQFIIPELENCTEKLKLRPNGTIILPGFNSNAVWGEWVFENKSVQIMQTDSFGFVYEGHYDIIFSGNNVTLKSPKTTLYCFPEVLFY